MPLAVATNRGGSMRDISRHYGLDRYFKVILTCKDVKRGKPHPDMLLLASEKLGIDPRELLFVGDMDVDREAAQRANIRFVGYRGDFPEAINITSHAQLLGLIDQL
jgi:HAD superfamily hydrolase (TIGR01549 family)